MEGRPPVVAHVKRVARIMMGAGVRADAKRPGRRAGTGACPYIGGSVCLVDWKVRVLMGEGEREVEMSRGAGRDKVPP
mgnify:CR=1 FL=1